MRVCLTGATGSLGSALSKKLIEQGHTVVSYARDEYRQAMLRKELGDNLIPFLGDVRDYRRLEEAAELCDIVIHAAALKRLDYDNWNNSEIVSVNVEGSRNVSRLKCRKIFISTDKAYNPTSGYGMTKFLAESFFQPDIIIRLGNLVDSRGAVKEIWEKQKKSGEITITSPFATRFWMTIQDGVDYILRVMDTNSIGVVYPEKLRGFFIVDLAEIIAPKAKRKVIGLFQGEKFHESFTEEYRSDLDIMSKVELRNAYKSI